MLEGTLDTFSLPDIFQLLAFTKKSGCLHLRRDEQAGRVWFRDGQVHYAVATTGRLALGKRLAGAGLVTAEQLREALQHQQGSPGTRLGRILVEQGVIDQGTLQTFVREQVQDAVFDLMRWADGNFSFDGRDGIEEPIGLTVTVENLIMEGSRRLQEWDAIRKKIPGRGAVVAMAPAPADGEVEVNLRPEEWRLLAMVDGRRTVGDLVELAGQGEFTTCKLLYGMVGAGLLEVRDPDVHGPPSIAALLEQQELLRELERSVDEAEAAALDRAATVRPITSGRRLAEAASAAEELSTREVAADTARAHPAAAADTAREHLAASPTREPARREEPVPTLRAAPDPASTDERLAPPRAAARRERAGEPEPPRVTPPREPAADQPQRRPRAAAQQAPVEEPQPRPRAAADQSPADEPQPRPRAAAQQAPVEEPQPRPRATPRRPEPVDRPNGTRKLTTDPDLDAALLDRLIDGVRGL